MLKRLQMSKPLIHLLLVTFLAGHVSSPAAERASRGQEIYQQLCAKCHGGRGEGVKGEYEEPLVGDWSIARLARVIDRTMPDDDPKKCKGKDAEEVARYIHDAFYSREARARNQTARIELAHLTNRQYLNSVADLLKHFIGQGDAVGPERGLRAEYYKSRSPRRGDRAFERLDPQVNFDYGAGSPDAERIKTEEFSMAWRGAVLADESGEYEFILKTPNGARLWVNDEETALIDAWVASGELTEHKAALRLIGGRAYPIRLEYFKFKDKTASISLQWKPPHGTQQPIPARNLAPARVTPTLVVSTPFPPDDSSAGYERGVLVSKAWDEATTHAAIEVADYIVKRLDRLAGTEPGDKARTARCQAFCQQFVETAFRAPLTDEEKRVFVTSRFAGADSPENAVKRVVLLTLKSPRFLYPGLANARPDDFAVASRLSFGLWDSLPDRELLKAAAEGRLRTPDQVAQQAARMLGDPRARAKTQHFLHHWLQMNQVEDLSKDATLFPGFTDEIIADLRASLNLFLEEAVWSASSDYRQLLLADYLYMNDRLAKFYGVDLPPGTPAGEFVKVRFEPGRRSGLVTHPYLLAAFSYQKSTSPIHRGVFLTRNIIGRALKPPPQAVEFKESDFSPKMTMREKVAKLTRPQACQTCHSVINPLGFSLENFDAVGRFRTEEGDRKIDPSADYTTDDGEKVRLTGARDLAAFAAESEQAQAGFIEQLFHQVVKQPVLAYGPHVLDQLRQSFVASHFNVRKLLVDIVTIAALHGGES